MPLASPGSAGARCIRCAAPAIAASAVGGIRRPCGRHANARPHNAASVARLYSSSAASARNSARIAAPAAASCAGRRAQGCAHRANGCRVHERGSCGCSGTRRTFAPTDCCRRRSGGARERSGGGAHGGSRGLCRSAARAPSTRWLAPAGRLLSWRRRGHHRGHQRHRFFPAIPLGRRGAASSCARLSSRRVRPPSRCANASSAGRRVARGCFAGSCSRRRSGQRE